jgi:parallel beta-helix repeat protein
MKMLRFTSAGWSAHLLLGSVFRWRAAVLAKTFGVALGVGGYFLLSTLAFPQGSLIPPGAPAPTMKTLDQVEARTIVNAANTPGDATNQFIITAPGSYYLTGNITGVSGKHGISINADNVTVDLNGFALVGAGSGLFDGIHVPATRTNLCIRNGTIRNWGNNGIDLSNSNNNQIERLRVSNNGGNGMAVGPGSTVIACTAAANTAAGFFIGDGAVVSQCSATGNGAAVVNNGFSLGNGVAINGCTAAENTGSGIATADGCTIKGCTVRSNVRSGISVPARCLVTDNNCLANGFSASFAGIVVSSTGNRIEGNNVVGNSSGIRVDSGGNLVVRNSARSNTSGDYIGGDLASSAVGEILDFTAGGTITNASPWANFRN